MSAFSKRLRWLEALSPGNFALVMATGIISFAFDQTGIPLLAQTLFGVTVLAWVTLVMLSCWRVVQFPRAVRIDLLNIRRVP